MALASTSITTTSRNVFTATSSTNTDSSNLYPRSQSEQYWAVRALTAETLLSARKEHFEDLQTVTILQETKRVTEVAQLTKLYDERLVKLEKLLVILLGVLFILTFSVFFSHLASTHGGQKDSISRSQWAHFTIPILSPFASVVEHEVSVVGSKTILGLCLIIASLAYVLLRHWKNGGQRAG
ncbi:hypothetical protein J3R30DRAFT_3277116 [Lentinula aciculospora]|uniref:Uncharacterized protein n=1 Tax=Lentinula aciculospora TaxID=153920 RepID=A0A9W9AV52_9AGAR|nr:hypothetical protein J3R30DRAFT_3277116 [Lentinula aciculospora]